MSESGEFVFVPSKLTVRDSVMQIGNNTSKSKASIHSRTALNAGETENLVTDQLEAVQQREHRDTQQFLGTGKSSRRRCQYQEGKEARECCNNKQNQIQSLLLVEQYCSNRKIGVSTGHGSHTPLQNDGNKLIMDLAQRLQTLGVHALADMQTCYVFTQTLYEHAATSICAGEEVLTVALKPS